MVYIHRDQQPEVPYEKSGHPSMPCILHGGIRRGGTVGPRQRPLQAVPYAEHVDVPEAGHHDRENLAGPVFRRGREVPVRNRAEFGGSCQEAEAGEGSRAVHAVRDAEHVQFCAAGPDRRLYLPGALERGCRPAVRDTDIRLDAPVRAFPGSVRLSSPPPGGDLRYLAGSGYIARRPVRACSTPAPLLQRSRASASPPQGGTIPNANAGTCSLIY